MEARSCPHREPPVLPETLRIRLQHEKNVQNGREMYAAWWLFVKMFVWAIAHAVIASLAYADIFLPSRDSSDAALSRSHTPESSERRRFAVFSFSWAFALINLLLFGVRAASEMFEYALNDRDADFLSQAEFLEQAAVFFSYGVYGSVLRFGFDGLGNSESAKPYLTVQVLLISTNGALLQVRKGLSVVGKCIRVRRYC